MTARRPEGPAAGARRPERRGEGVERQESPETALPVDCGREAPLLVMETLLIEELETLRRALEYYADPSHYRRYGPDSIPVHPILAEGGRLAREALGLPQADARPCQPVREEPEAWVVLRREEAKT